MKGYYNDRIIKKVEKHWYGDSIDYEDNWVEVEVMGYSICGYDDEHQKYYLIKFPDGKMKEVRSYRVNVAVPSSN